MPLNWSASVLRTLTIVLAMSPWMEICCESSSIMKLPSNKSDGTNVWTDWSLWSKCSKSCQVGIRVRSRVCNHSQGHSSFSPATRTAICQGKSTEYGVCGSKSCQKLANEDRQFQCNSHSGRIIRNKKIESWIPSEKVSNPCELICWAENHQFSHGFGKVADGTPCFEEEEVHHVCLNGRCMPVGCDGIVNSMKTYDVCGVCGGHNHTCYRVKGIFTPNKLWPAGGNLNYAEVVSIPIGAINILVQDKSDSYLALLDDAQSPIINGNRLLDPPGEYVAGGTTFNYSGGHTNTETLEAKGPMANVVHVMAMLRSQNPKIYFEYWIPRTATKEFKTIKSTTPPPPTTTALQTASLSLTGSNYRRKPSITSAQAYQSSSSKRHPNIVVESDGDGSNNETGLTKKKSKQRKDRKCPQCSRGRNIKQQFCNSDFVIQTKVVHYQEAEGKYRYELEVIRSFKNSIPLQSREYLWILDGCRCPKMSRNREYLVMGTSEKSVTKREMRLVVSRNSYVRRYGHRRALKILQIKRNESNLCGNAKALKKTPINNDSSL